MQIGVGKSGVKIGEYGSERDGLGVLGWIEPAGNNPQWILWFDSKGDAILYTEREATGAVVGEPLKLEAHKSQTTKHQSEVKRLKDEIAQLDTQLAGCLTAAEGWSCEQYAKKGDYGWSPAYQTILDLRKKYDNLLLLKSSLPKIVLKNSEPMV